MLRGRTTAPSIGEFGQRFTKVAQLMLLRLNRGAQKLFTFSYKDRMYSGLHYAPTEAPGVSLEAPPKQQLPDRRRSRQIFSKFKEIVGGQSRVGTIRAQKLLPLGANPALMYRQHQSAVSRSDDAAMQQDSTVMFATHAFVAIRGAQDKVWIARLTTEVTVHHIDNKCSISVVWLEQDKGTGQWTFGTADSISASSLVCEVTEDVNTDPLNVSEDAVMRARQQLAELLQESRRGKDKDGHNENGFGPAYRTTRADRAKRRHQQKD